MLISLNWIRDFVDLPSDLDPKDLAERFTRTTAEVEDVRPVRVSARGLIAARVVEAKEVPGTADLRHVVLEVGNGKTVESVTAAPVIHTGAHVVFAPPGASVAACGQVGTAKIAGKSSAGMILPGDAIGIPMAAQEAVFLSTATRPGEPLDCELFDDWVLDIDNKSLTHRPDLWGHYGVSREIAAIFGQPLKPYPVVDIKELLLDKLPKVEVSIADRAACPRYTALVVEGVGTQPAPLWMQLRLGHVGQRPISGLVDLTNYIMADLGQPMHAFDAAKVNRIEVDWAKEGERFRTLDGVDRTLAATDLMIQCQGRSVALAGIMGGLEAEVSEATTTLLLESANFDPTTVRRTAKRLGLRTDASARFEKSLDPTNTALGIQRFIELARSMYPKLRLTAGLSDNIAKPLETTTVMVARKRAARTIGRPVSTEEATSLLEPLGFGVTPRADEWAVEVPSFRATGDVSIEADVIEEIARCIGYNAIPPVMPRVSLRHFEVNALHELEQRTLEHFTAQFGYNEIQGYLWDDPTWFSRLGIDPGPCVEVVNPAAEGLGRLRRTLMPGLLAAVAKNRFHHRTLSIIELGSVLEPTAAATPASPEDREFRHVALVSAQRETGIEKELYQRVKGAIESWSWQRFGRRMEFASTPPAPDRPWEQPRRTAALRLGGADAGRISVVARPLRRLMDEHLTAWTIVWAEIRLSGLEGSSRVIESLDSIPQHPLVEMDFSLLVPRAARYDRVSAELASFTHPLLSRIRFVGSYEGDAIGPDQRSLTFRTVVGDPHRTLVDEDANAFRDAFERYIIGCGYSLRG